MKVGKPEVMSNMNKNAILKLLRDEGPLSKAEIARKLKMSFPAVSSNVRILLESGIVLETGEGKGNNGLGRKSTLLSFNAKKGFVIGVDVGRSQIRAMCSDLLGEPVAMIKKDSNADKSGEYLYSRIENILDEIISENKIMADKIECICIGIPGIHDESCDKNRLAPFVDGWEDINVRERVEKKWNTKVIIDNVVNLGAVGEKWKGVAQGYRDIVFINYGIGIGAGIIINNELYRGKNNAAGEIGYMTLDRFYMRRFFKEEGALEELISGASLNNSLKLLNSGDKDYCMEEIIEMAKAGDMNAKKIIGDSIVYLSMMMINIISIINPELVVLSGRVGIAMFERYRNVILDMVTAHAPYLPEFSISDLGDQGGVIGAVGVATRYAKSKYNY